MSQWCYVDEAACSSVRKPARSSILPVNAYYSYLTCGNLDKFTGTAPFPVGRPLRISTGISPPQVVAGNSVAGWPLDGAQVAFVDAVLKNFDPPPEVNITGGYATAESMAACTCTCT